jgi:8-oxo-dGTP pyrophosphatase MutT (NUDIX family)
VVSKAHAVEPFELDNRGVAFWTDAMRVAAALEAHYGPTKMNYEIHGNTIPHLHMHLYPRRVGDAFDGGPIDGSARNALRSADELQALRSAVVAQPTFTPPIAAVGVVVRRGAEVLLAKHRFHADKRYVLVAGYVQAGESIEEAAVREVAEETGLTIVVDRLLESYVHTTLGLPILFVACEARVVGGDLNVDEVELEDARWFSLDALPDWPTTFPVARVFARLLQEP